MEKPKNAVDGPLIVKHDICEFTYNKIWASDSNIESFRKYKVRITFRTSNSVEKHTLKINHI